MDKDTEEYVLCEQTSFVLAGFSAMNRADRIVFVFNNNTGGLVFMMPPENLPLALVTPYPVVDATDVPYNMVLVENGLSLYQPDTNPIIKQVKNFFVRTFFGNTYCSEFSDFFFDDL